MKRTINLFSLVIIISLLISALGLFTTPAQAATGSVGATLYVAAAGNDTNDCKNPSTPCATINAAIGKATNSDTISVAIDTYTGSGTEVVLVNKSVTLSGGWDTSFTIRSGVSTIDGQGTRRSITVNSGVTAMGEYFVIQNGVSDAIYNGGGGVSNSGTFTLNNSTVIQNSASGYAGGGGGIYNAPSGIMIINNSTITGNTTNANAFGGGGIRNEINGTLTLNNSVVTDNTISGIHNPEGAGIYNHGTMTINNSSVNNNKAAGIYVGGGISNFFGTMILNNTTISNNIAYSGAGIYSSGPMTVNNSTISYNNASEIGGVYNGSSNGMFTMRNTIIANNTASIPDCNSYLITSVITSAGHNIIGNATSCNFTLASGDLINTDPKLGQLIGNPSFVPLLPNSPAIDAGDPATCLSTDQRGISRPQGSACDIGAYEYQEDNMAPTVSTITRANPNSTALNLINYTVTFSEAVSGVDATDFALTTAGVHGAGITNVTGTGSYTVSVNTGAGNGTIRLDLVDDDSIKDAATNALGGAGTGNGNYTSGEVYKILKGADTAGVFRPSNGLLYLKNQNACPDPLNCFADIAINYGIASDYPVVGDWDGDGTVTIGIYRNGSFYLRNFNTVGFADLVFPFGQVGDQPIAGDWNGDGIDTIGIFRPSTGLFMLRNSNDAGPADAGSFILGNPGDVGIAGDWTNKGFDTVGVFRPSNGIIFLKNTNTTGFADIALNYGIPGDRPVTGDWDNDGIDTIGVYRNGTFLLRNTNDVGFADISFGLGNPGDMPIAGNWDGLP